MRAAPDGRIPAIGEGCRRGAQRADAVLSGVLVALLVGLLSGVVEGAEPVRYSREVRPILARNCFQCHGLDEADRKGELRLDHREAAVADREGGAAIVPGDPERSWVWRLVDHEDPEKRMPPAKSGKVLKPEEKGILKRWIEEGANYSGHWAFEPPIRPELPLVQDVSWPRNALDRFVLARLEREGVPPSPEADAVTLLRRLSLDLIGLPPLPEDVDRFKADGGENAYERAVERLLSSPHYGERWGRLWLDAARYADTDGYEKDKPRTVWFYRDWVVNAFNRDLPYDQFVLEQLAGDLLPAATQDQIVATGFLRNSMLNEEGGIDPEQFRMDAMFDRMDAIGKGVLGLTIQCAQCHDHKYDPLSQGEYYQLFAYLNNAHEAMPVVYTPDALERVKSLRTRMEEIEARLRRENPGWRDRMAEWERGLGRDEARWEVLELANVGDNAQRYFRQEDGSLLAAGWAPTRFTALFEATNRFENMAALRLEVLTDPNLPAGGPGRAEDGLFALTQIDVSIAPVMAAGEPQPLKLVGAFSDFQQPETDLPARYTDGSKDRRVTGGVGLAIDGDDKTAWGNDRGAGRRNRGTVGMFQLETPVKIGGEAVLRIELRQLHGGKNGNDFVTKNLGRFRIAFARGDAFGGEASVDAVARRLEGEAAAWLPRELRELAAVPAAERAPEQTAALFRHWRRTVPEWGEANGAIEKLWGQWPEGTTAYTLRAREEPRRTAVLKRGDWLKPERPVSPGVPAFLHPMPEEEGGDRLALARWLASERSPTTARVFVNRLWQALFGEGLVSTVEDFGLQSAPPSHPELLDWLATEFMRSGWRVKELLRLMVTSATYRQKSDLTPGSLGRDPYNRLLARGARFRVDAELVRDVTLQASGLLNPAMGGPSVMVPAPEFLFKPPASYGDFPWHNEEGPAKYRRGIYTYRRRSTPFPALTVFDAPPGDFSCVRRQRSNTPLQALTLLNEPLFMEAARALARRTVTEGGAGDDARIIHAFRRCVARTPGPGEVSVVRDLLIQQRAYFGERREQAEQLAGAAEGDAEPAELAAWTVVARTLMNLDETVTRE